MGIAGMWWRFEHGPPTLEQLAERLSASSGLPVDAWRSSPSSGVLNVQALASRVEVSLAEDGTLELLLDLNESPFLWTHLNAAVTDLGGVREHANPRPPPAWTTRAWSQIGAWRRYTVRHRHLIQLALWPLYIPLLPFLAVYTGIRHLRETAGGEDRPASTDRRSDS